MMYLNDLYSLILGSDDFCTWRLINAQCLAQPPARESHSACLYKPGNSGGEKLIIYGGMNGHRLDDVWSLDISTYTWSQYSIPWGSNTPPARSMHAATIAGSRMFVFGGWAPSDKHTNNDGFVSPKRLCCFNLADKKWEKLDEQSSKHTPYPRTGHSMVVVQDKIYMWSGRTGSHYHDDVTVLNDLWSLQVTPQKVVNRLILSNKTETMIKVEWDPVPLASYYILQIQMMPMANPESRTGLFSSSLNQISNSKTLVPTKLSMESSKPNISKKSIGQVSIPMKNNLVPIPLKPKINTYQCLSPKFSTKVSTPMLSTALSNTIANHVSASKVSCSTKNNSTKTSTVAFNFGKNKNSIPIVTTRVCFSKEKSSSNTPSRVSALCLPTPEIPICVINTPVTHTSSAKHVIHTPVTCTPSAKHVIHTPGT
ncbi:hypothetical protein LSTR_LSTR017064 [Laodelphax striatellus]|uniref:Host cell factor Kelch-repeats domain-containing protein n=1 Tax=Laodelphax striatellus TaxID=195883 RepID=A0A482WZE4_LAOST|nr:hypothetical protein LSTR_LSTR017064 [Laodelphax striatellus]